LIDSFNNIEHLYSATSRKLYVDAPLIVMFDIIKQLLFEQSFNT